MLSPETLSLISTLLGIFASLISLSTYRSQLRAVFKYAIFLVSALLIFGLPLYSYVKIGAIQTQLNEIVSKEEKQRQIAKKKQQEIKQQQIEKNKQIKAQYQMLITWAKPIKQSYATWQLSQTLTPNIVEDIKNTIAIAKNEYLSEPRIKKAIESQRLITKLGFYHSEALLWSLDAILKHESNPNTRPESLKRAVEVADRILMILENDDHIATLNSDKFFKEKNMKFNLYSIVSFIKAFQYGFSSQDCEVLSQLLLAKSQAETSPSMTIQPGNREEKFYGKLFETIDISEEGKVTCRSRYL